jgi:DNA relaxase NicK
MTTSPLTDSIIVALHKLDEIHNDVFRAECYGRIKAEIHRLQAQRQPERKDMDALDAEEKVHMLRNSVVTLEDRIAQSGADDDEINQALTVAEEHAHALRAQI